MTLPPAKWWRPADCGATECTLCPRGCTIADGKTGFCGVRQNVGGELFSLSYGHPVSIAIDPVEKKPLARFMPGTRTFSLGTFGCNLGCVFCQNHSLSRGNYTNDPPQDFISPEQIVKMALYHGCPSISYTYNEPTVFAEYVFDIARAAHHAGLKNILVSNGFITDDASDAIYPLMDAANIDMKGFRHNFYENMCQASLEPVLQSILKLHRLDVHLEITTLVIPGKNDDDDSIQSWLAWAKDNLGTDIPLHFSAYHPAWKCRIPPTPPQILYRIHAMAREAGFAYVFLGNI